MNVTISSTRAAKPRTPPMTLSVIVLIRESELVDFSESDVEAVGVGVDVVLVDVAASVVELEGNAVDSVASI